MALGQFFNGMAGPVTQAGPPVLSSIWFPPHERTTATALSSLAGSMGIAVSFVIGPLFVGEHVSGTRYRLVSMYSMSRKLLLEKMESLG